MVRNAICTYVPMSKNHLSRICSYVLMSKKSNQLDVFRLHLHGRGEQHGNLHENPLVLGAADGDQGTFVAIEGTADDADFPVAHVGSNLLRRVVSGRLRAFHRKDEAFHVAVGNGHRLAPRVAQVAVLEGADALHQRVEHFARGIYEQQILDERYLPGLSLASLVDHLPYQRGELADVLSP